MKAIRVTQKLPGATWRTFIVKQPKKIDFWTKHAKNTAQTIQLNSKNPITEKYSQGQKPRHAKTITIQEIEIP